MSITQEQMMNRSKFIGGSDAAGILGLSKWSTPLSIWSQKTGQVIPKDISDEMPIRLGKKLEPAVCELFEEETGKKLVPSPDTLYHPKYPFIGGNLDRIVHGESAFFEAKTTTSFKQHDWEDGIDEIPVEYILQCYHYLNVTGFQRAYIGCLIGNRNFIWRTIERDEKVLDDLLAKEIAFWNTFVLPRVMPGPATNDGSILNELFPLAVEGSVLELDEEANKIIETLKTLQADEKVWKEGIDTAKNKLRAILGTHETGVSDTYKITWKNQTVNRLDTDVFKQAEPALFEKYCKETNQRVLRIATKKGE